MHVNTKAMDTLMTDAMMPQSENSVLRPQGKDVLFHRIFRLVGLTVMVLMAQKEEQAY